MAAQWAQKVALITGGMGRSSAHLFAKEGAAVVIRHTSSAWTLSNKSTRRGVVADDHSLSAAGGHDQLYR
ncbi:hypothetical protein [Streptosporangium saharense]|uniref:hypothetical protein n=1 Tax=Streptosporangium saharense TaxID=1706840 RepID=UPI0036C14A8E